MTLLKKIIDKILLNENVSVNDISDAIDGHKRIVITYKTEGKNVNNEKRIIEIYSYGLTNNGNPVIKAFQTQGDTSSKTPEWKLFRVDRITSWKDTGETFSEPQESYIDSDDKSMNIIFKMAKFDNV